MNQLCARSAFGGLAVLLALCCATRGLAQDGAQGKLLFHERFEKVGMAKGASVTLPAPDPKSGGRIAKPFKLAPGARGLGLELTGGSNVRYDRFTPINLHGGELSFDVKLLFDTEGDSPERRGKFRNQLFLTISQPKVGTFSVYSTHGNPQDMRVCIQDPARNILKLIAVPQKWKTGEWVSVRVAWGRELSLTANGKTSRAADWQGLFGPLPIVAKEFPVRIGTSAPGSIQNAFVMDELTIRGPRDGDVAWRPLLAVPKVEATPELDGALDEAFWEQAAKTAGFGHFQTGRLGSAPADVLLAATPEALLVGARIRFDADRKPQAALTNRDGAVYTEDAFEMFFAPTSGARFYHLIVSAAGTRLDASHDAPNSLGDVQWNPDWQAATAQASGGWTAEVRVPWAALGLDGPPEAGAEWKANFCIDDPQGQQRYRSWAFTRHLFSNRPYFGTLAFTGGERTLRLQRLVQVREGNPQADVKLVGQFPPIVTVDCAVYGPGGASVFARSTPLRDSQTASFQCPYLMKGDYLLSLTAADEKGRTLFKQHQRFTPEAEFSVGLAHYPYAGEAVVTAKTGALKDVREIRVRVLDKNRVLKSQTWTPPAKVVREAKIVLPTTDLPPGEYVVVAEAVARAKTVSARTTLRIFEKPQWWKNTFAMDHSVPRPWTAVTKTATGWAVWGREYQMGASVLPRQITSRRTSLLAGPVRLSLRAGGKTVDLGALKATASQSAGDAVTLNAAGSAAGITAQLRGVLEFDGCYRLDVDLAPGAASTVEGLILEIPVTREVARFALDSDCQGTGITPVKGATAKYFRPYHWLGNDDLGLAVFTESDEFWRPRDNRMIEILPKGDTVTLRWNIVRHPLRLDKPVRLTFGLMASPVRPIVEKDPLYPTSFGGNLTPVTFPEMLSYAMHQRIAPAQGTLECWFAKSAAARPSTEFLHLCARNAVARGLDVSLSQNNMMLKVARKPRPTVSNIPFGADWTHFAMTWDDKTLAVYVAGKRVAETAMDDALRTALTDASGPQGLLRFGSLSDYAGEACLRVDEVRVSSVKRYNGDSYEVPQAPFVEDKATLLLDELEVAFIPDGEDARTPAGGCPSVGCAVVAGRFGQAVQVENGPPRPVKELIEAYQPDLALLWNWRKSHFRTQSEWPPEFFQSVPDNLKDGIAARQALGLPTIAYVGYPAIGGPSRLVDQFADEWTVLPTFRMDYPPPAGHFMLHTSSAARGFADYVVAGQRWLMRDYGLDGVYMDGIGTVMRSTNAYYGAGYDDEKGVRHATFPIFGVREAEKRIYRQVKALKPNGLVVNHSSFNLILPVVCFSDILFTGEHENYEDLDAIRLRFSSRPWGLQLSLIGASSHWFEPLHMGVSQLHGTPIMTTCVYPGYNDLARKTHNMRKVYQRFGTTTAEWTPYFKSQPGLLTTTDKRIKISVYHHAGKDALLFVMNMKPGDGVHPVRINLRGLGLDGMDLKAKNALTEVPITVDATGLLEVPVRGKSFTMVLVQQKEN